MAKYDFETVVCRQNTGSMKWDGPLAPDSQLEGDIVPFTIADMELRHPDAFIDALQHYVGLSTTLGYGLATEGYYTSICNWMSSRHSWQVDPAWIIECSSVIPAIHEIVAELLEPDEGAIIMTPVYAPFYTAVTGPRRRLVENPLIYQGGRYEIDFENLEREVKDPKNKLLIMSSPHNPVSRLWTLEELTKIGNLCVENGVIVVADEIHFDFIMPGGEHHVFANICDDFAQSSITCTGPCKTFNLAGLHAANMIIPNRELRERINQAHVNNGFSRLGSLAYFASELAYNTLGEWVDEVVALVAKNQKILADFIAQRVPGIYAIPMEATYMQWLDCTGLGMQEPELLAFMRQKAGLYLSNGSRFGAAGNGFLRMNLACPTHVVVAALERLEKAVAARNAHT